jgi:hypothetical protein
MKCANCGVDALTDAMILREAGKIRAALRKKRGGGRPAALYPCRYCAELQVGRVSLELHERVCPKRPQEMLVEIGPGDLQPWVPPRRQRGVIQKKRRARQRSPLRLL